MASETQILQAACLCGSSNHNITLNASDIPVKGHMCHCNSCRHTYGSMCATLITAPAYYQPSQSLVDKLTRYDFSSSVAMYFCPICGCHMLAQGAPDPKKASTWFIASGTLENIEGIVDWYMHEFVRDTLDGGFADFLPSVNGKRLPRYSGQGPASEQEELPLLWTSPDLTTTTPSPTDKLEAQCKCTGVTFYVSRPSARSALAENYWPDFPPPNPPASEKPKSEPVVYLRDNGTKFLAAHCACNSCRLASGMETTTWAFVSTCDISLSPTTFEPWTPSFGTLKQYTSSPGCYRYFCRRCGAFVFYDAEGRKHFKDIAFGLFHAPEGSRAESWFGWRTSRIGYRDDAVPRAESYNLALEKGLREWKERRPGKDSSGGSASSGAL